MMVFALGVFAALFLGLGWVLQQRIAAHAAVSELLSLRLLLHLARKPVWWAGISAMVVGQILGAVALRFGAVSLVEPLLSTNLLFAFLIATVLARSHVRWYELGGAALLSAALGVFIEVGRPEPSTGPLPAAWTVLLTAGVLAVIATGLVAAGRRSPLATEAVLIATAAGVLYGFEDAGTRGASLSLHRGGLSGLLTSPWPYLVVTAAIVSIVFMQSAFGAARLDLSLPPTAAAEPVTGVLIGVGLLGGTLATSPVALAVQALCLTAMLAAVIIIGRSHPIASSTTHHLRAVHGHGESNR